MLQSALYLGCLTKTFFDIVLGSTEWDAIHVYIANNIDFIKRWTKRCEEFYGELRWNDLVEMIRKDYLDHDISLIHQQIDLAFGAKDRNVSHV